MKVWTSEDAKIQGGSTRCREGGLMLANHQQLAWQQLILLVSDAISHLELTQRLQCPVPSLLFSPRPLHVLSAPASVSPPLTAPAAPPAWGCRSWSCQTPDQTSSSSRYDAQAHTTAAPTKKHGGLSGTVIG